MLTPLAKKIIVQPIDIKAGGLILTNVKSSQFQVVSVGDEITRVKPGDIIYLEKHYGAELDHEGQKYLVIEEAWILAKV